MMEWGQQVYALVKNYEGYWNYQNNFNTLEIGQKYRKKHKYLFMKTIEMQIATMKSVMFLTRSALILGSPGR